MVCASNIALAKPYYCPSDWNTDAFNYRYVYDTEFDVCDQYRSSGNPAFKILILKCGGAFADFGACRIQSFFLKERYQRGACKPIVVKEVKEPNCKGYVYGVKGTKTVVDRYVTFGGDACAQRLKKLYPKASDKKLDK